MSKLKTVYTCQNCGTQAPKWMGKCGQCGQWNTFVEEVVVAKKEEFGQDPSLRSKSGAKPQLISAIETKAERRIDTQNHEFNRVLGGGLVNGSVVLIGGEPGIGKSTLVLQIAMQLVGVKTLYISGEESEMQIKLRAERLLAISNSCYILSETNLENILQHIRFEMPGLIVIDSIQTLQTERIESSAGSVSQIRECTSGLLKVAKEMSVPVLLIGHINKEGNLAGPKVLEHIVDTVLQFEGDRNYMYRIMRATKNRFGSTSEIGIFEMHNDGLHEVHNPSELLLSHSSEALSGISIAATLEGMRPFLIEVQALVSSAAYGIPQRSSTGFDLRRLSMLLAVLEKRCGFRLASKDVFLNIAGGIRVDDPAIDLSVICSVLSSDQDIAIPNHTCFAGEVGLSGEIRPVNRVEQRISEAEKLGFQQIFVSKHNQKGLTLSKYNIRVRFVSKVEEVFAALFG